MTTKRRKFVAVLLLAVIGGGIAYWLLNRSDEPEYQGRRLSDWLEQYDKGLLTPLVPNEAPQTAVRAIGTNALPHLVKWLSYETSPWRHKLREKLPGSITSRPSVYHWLEGEDRRAILAIQGFALLETNAASAIPQLEALMKNQAKPAGSIRGIFALRSIGAPALPVLRAGLADSSQSNRVQIILSFGVQVGDQMPLTDDFGLPLVIEALTHDDLEVREAATNVLQWFAPDVLSDAAAK